MPPRTRSIQQIRRELAAKERQVRKLESRRRRLTDELARVDREIAAATGDGRRAQKATGMKAARRGRPPKTAGRRRRATGRPLTEYLVDVLKRAKKPMRVKDICSAATKAGYKSYSKDFYGIVAATLRDQPAFSRVGRGLYKLAG